MAFIARKLIHQLRLDIFDCFLVLPASFYRRQKTGTLLSRIIFDVEQVAEAIAEALKNFIREGLAIIGLIAYLFYL